ncbi:MAG: HAD hydrolase-like protein, partial [Bacteroidota bacterium]|nr:HAD hydrolase-like protein [Bacteroidota bacterium]
KQLQGKYTLIVATKGDLLDQERKLKKSGLEKYFHHIEVMSDKTEINYQNLLNHLDINPKEFLMVGNSVKSDIMPVINIGGQAIHIPFYTTWVHEEFLNAPSNKFISLEKVSEILELLK